MKPTAQNPARSLVDPYGRRLHYFRMSVTDRCNYRCLYCMPAGGLDKLKHHEVLTLEEMARTARAAVALGVDKIRLTGGEPLFRRDLGVLLQALSRLDPKPDLRITTNGYFLEENLEMLIKYGVSTVNISLDTLDPYSYGPIVGLGGQEGIKAFKRVWSAIEAALGSGRIKVKINVVLLSGVNAGQIPEFARLTERLPVAVRFIEYMPVGSHKHYEQKRFISSDDVLESLAELGSVEPLPSRPGDGPAQCYRLPGAVGEVGVISAVSSHFCAACNRLRLSAEGKLVPCLLSSRTLDIKTTLRSGCSQGELEDLLLAAAHIKPLRHNQNPDHLHASGCPMSRLGG